MGGHTLPCSSKGLNCLFAVTEATTDASTYATRAAHAVKYVQYLYFCLALKQGCQTHVG